MEVTPLPEEGMRPLHELLLRRRKRTGAPDAILELTLLVLRITDKLLCLQGNLHLLGRETLLDESFLLLGARSMLARTFSVVSPAALERHC
jgi:hypothetical protein